ncbi:MAG: sigma-70 family RNA polymerase sigma factor [Pirellula sp.]|jgi:RNA polymerase sigma-70 factor (ECF subfamily)|nr:sigma-70 family RNA polymerase sigma factor [Pirellula sp.]
MSEPPEREEALLQRAASGDQRAFADLMEPWRQRLRTAIALRMDQRLGVRIDPSDVLQEAMVVASLELGKYAATRPMPFYDWLQKLAFQKLIDLQRRHIFADRRSILREERRSQWNDTTLHHLAKSLSGYILGPQSAALAAEREVQLLAALASLENAYQEILYMHYVENRSLTEAAESLEISPSTARTRHYRALRKLRELLRDQSS